MSIALASRLGVCALLAASAVVLRVAGVEMGSLASVAVFGVAVVAAAFVLAWTVEAAQKDISGGLAIAILALIAVLPEYAVALYYTYRAGWDPAFLPHAAANMTGSNRLLLGVEWQLVVLLGARVAGRVRPRRAVLLLALFAAQFVVTGQEGRYVLSAVQALIAVGFLAVHREQILPALAAPFQAAPRVAGEVWS